MHTVLGSPTSPRCLWCGLSCGVLPTGAHQPIALSPSAHSTRRTPPSQSLPQKRDVDARSSDPRCALRRSGTERPAAAAARCAAELVVISWSRHLKMEIRAQSDWFESQGDGHGRALWPYTQRVKWGKWLTSYFAGHHLKWLFNDILTCLIFRGGGECMCRKH